MKASVSCEVPNDRTDSADLQGVVTRCIDSACACSQAAGRMRHPDLSAMLRDVSAHRVRIARELAELIRGQGGEAEQRASMTSTMRRGWLSLRRTIAGEPLGRVVAECIRGEHLLLTALENALDSQEVTRWHADALRNAREEVTATIHTFRNAHARFRSSARVRPVPPIPLQYGQENLKVVAKGNEPHGGTVDV